MWAWSELTFGLFRSTDVIRAGGIFPPSPLLGFGASRGVGPADWMPQTQVPPRGSEALPVPIGPTTLIPPPEDKMGLRSYQLASLGQDQDMFVFRTHTYRRFPRLCCLGVRSEELRDLAKVTLVGSHDTTKRCRHFKAALCFVGDLDLHCLAECPTSPRTKP